MRRNRVHERTSYGIPSRSRVQHSLLFPHRSAEARSSLKVFADIARGAPANTCRLRCLLTSMTPELSRCTFRTTSSRNEQNRTKLNNNSTRTSLERVVHARQLALSHRRQLCPSMTIDHYTFYRPRAFMSMSRVGISQTTSLPSKPVKKRTHCTRNNNKRRE